MLAHEGGKREVFRGLTHWSNKKGAEKMMTSCSSKKSFCCRPINLLSAAAAVPLQIDPKGEKERERKRMRSHLIHTKGKGLT